MLTGLRTDITAMKDMIGNDENAKVADDNKKQLRIMYLEGILTKFLPSFRTFINKIAFCPLVVS